MEHDKLLYFIVPLQFLEVFTTCFTLELHFFTEFLDVLCKLVDVVFGEIDSAFFILLDLLQNRPVFSLDLFVCSIELLNALLVILVADLALVLSIDGLVHHFLDLILVNFPLFLS